MREVGNVLISNYSLSQQPLHENWKDVLHCLLNPEQAIKMYHNDDSQFFRILVESLDRQERFKWLDGYLEMKCEELSKNSNFFRVDLYNTLIISLPKYFGFKPNSVLYMAFTQHVCRQVEANLSIDSRSFFN